ncbi:histone deacetylase [Caulobacter vibrioides]|uniref:histone deacetylase family protein n=1 Tax=Caulobacter vibrioides TaxID=155892 RepID=UPI000BB4636D|nr:histone deacetylase [Caulobacter vibrioides]ATC26542.1 histone deacetylase [Caulobacter vibrioides]AZH14627.1 histone deacetylase [Caulobacter vibrioides]PLR12366.1 histone deacetylase [Caulobacter vibrioides]
MSAPPPIVHHPAFRAEMPAGHRFPMDKFSRLAALLEAERVAGPDGFARPEPVDVETLCLAHSEDYVRGVIELSLPPDIVRRIGMPNTESVATRARAATGGTLLAARLALAHGVACNTAGGSHHAAADSGAGFCVFNDVAVAARRLLAEGAIGKALVVDLDVHQGDGTARIFENDPSVFTFSMHAEKNFPHRKASSDLDIELPDGTDDGAYLAKLEEILPALLISVRPDIVFFNAGVDPHADDKLGRLALTDEGLARREAYVLGACLSSEIPVVGVIGGGYDADIDRLAARHAILHRTAKSLCSL